MDDAREWLETDGLGGYAIGTVDGIRTRRYHGVLVAATRPPDGRMVLVAGLEVFVETAAGRYALSTQRYRGDVVHPDGRTRLVAFVPAPWPTWTWACADGTRIEGELTMTRGAPAVALRFTRTAGTGAARLWLRPLLAGRDHHALHHENPGFRFAPAIAGDRVTWRPYPGLPPIVCAIGGAYEHAPDWYRGFIYSEERARGLDAEEDLATPGIVLCDLAAGPARLAFAAGGFAGAADDPTAPAPALVDAMFAAEAERRAGFASPLARAADHYVVARGTGRTVIAGYPWFADWGRDTFIALRGLCLATGRFADARAMLCEWAGAVSAGMLPNRYGDGGAPEYNSVDAALWFVIAADAYLATPAATAGDRRVLADAIAAIVDGYAKGTRFRIGATADGLLACGEPGVQLTWMDAIVDSEVITPRIGKPVEIQALWLNALAIAGREDDLARGRAAFAARFWNAAAGHLYDVVDVDHVAGTADASCRPNQILAIGGLPRAILDGERARAAIDTVERELWTIAGPRTLARSDPRYRARYGGGPAERDRAYHNGPVWPWLAGPFVDAWCRVRGDTASVRADARARFIAPLVALADAGFGHLPELFTPEPPHAPCGCPFQAWSLAELIRVASTATR